MLAFACPVCRRLVTFESSLCLHCASQLGYDPQSRSMVAVQAPGDGPAGAPPPGRARAPADPDRAPAAPAFRCANAQLAACNWTVAAEGELCASCRLTRVRPSDDDPDGLGGFAAAESAKRRLLFELAQLELPVVSWREREGGLAFELLSSARGPVSTGHADGVITLDLDETDPAHRERMRVRLHEPYRTVLGHFRHEIGHYYQPLLLARAPDATERSRELFGDERADYQQAMDRFYRHGAPAGWEQRFVSAYATMHPWEDWAETFAHYLHIRDSVQTAAAYGVRVAGPDVATTDPLPLHSLPARAGEHIAGVLEAWIPLTYALNAISRSMGADDLYPFVLTAAVEAKLAFIDELVRVGDIPLNA